jgi:hypothetical protein
MTDTKITTNQILSALLRRILRSEAYQDLMLEVEPAINSEFPIRKAISKQQLVSVTTRQGTKENSSFAQKEKSISLEYSP